MANKKCVYKINEGFKAKKLNKVPLFENFIESKYNLDFTLVDNQKYKLSQDIVSQDGVVLAKAGDTIIYKDGMGTFGNKVESFVTDCGSFVTSDQQYLQPEVLLSNGVVVSPEAELRKSPVAPVAQVVAECRKLMRPFSRRIYESLSDEEKAKYKEASAKLTDEQKKKLTAKVDGLEEEAAAAGEAQDFKKLSSIYKSALQAYYKLTGGEEPEWYEGEDPYADMVTESLTDDQKAKYKEKQAKLTDEQKKQYTAEIDGLEEDAMKLQDEGKTDQIDKLTKKALEKYRILTGGEDPAWYEDYMDEAKFGVNESDDMGIEDISEDEVKESISEDVIEKDEVAEFLKSAEVEDAIAKEIVEELPAEKEEVSMVDVIKVAVAQELPAEQINAVIDIMADGAVEAGEAKIVNESAKAKIKSKIMESLKKSYRKSVFENRYRSRKK